jgi:lycopene cyclase domain-containing protein
MPIYPTLSVIAAVAVVLVEVRFLRTGIFRDLSYWVTMAICFGFMIPVDGWLTKLSAPIVVYRPEDTTGIRPIWDILIEEYVYAFALLTVVILVWERVGPTHAGAAGSRDSGSTASAPGRRVGRSVS